MQKLNTHWVSVFGLVAGFVLGLGASNYFAADDTGKDIASTPTNTSQQAGVITQAAESTEATVLSAALNAPKMSDNIDTQAPDMVANNTLSVDISLAETVDTGRVETAVTEPSPEQLVENLPDSVLTIPLNSQETDELESKLRPEPEHAALIPPQRDEGLLQHEML